MKSMERAILNRIRRCSLWAFLVSALVVLVIGILETWGALETAERGRLGDFEPNTWSKIDSTFTIVMGISLLVLLALLMAKYAKKDESRMGEARAAAATTISRAASSAVTAAKSAAKSASKRK